MLTVKHIRFDGAEEVDYADRVLYYPAIYSEDSNSGPLSSGIGGTVTVVRSGIHSIDHRDGTVYVMNGGGATVSKYVLGVPTSPAEGAASPDISPAQ